MSPGSAPTGNLAVFPLVRRLCDRIIVVDGEHDPTYQFASYFRLKDALAEEMRVDLSLPGIDPTSGGTLWHGEWTRRGAIGLLAADVVFGISSPGDHGEGPGN